MEFGIGKPVRRKEDLRLVTGRGEFCDDLNLPRQAFVHFLRSPHAHASIGRIDVTVAAQAPGVIAVLTGRDYVADGLKPIPNNPEPPDLPFNAPVRVPPDYPLAVDKVRHVGEIVAVVVAERRNQAIDAAEEIEVDYDVLPAVVDVPGALAPGAPLVWDDIAQNTCVVGYRGDEEATDAAFAAAAHVTRMDIKNNRVNGIPLEPGAAIGDFDAKSGRLTVHAPGQGVLIQKRALCGSFGLDESKVRVICRDVGGGYGTRNLVYREHVLVGWASRRIGRPVKWRGDRSESFVSDPYGRDQTSHIELALDAKGKFLAMRAHNIANIGSQAIHLIPLCRGAAVTNGVYVVPTMHITLQAVFTNTVPTSTYRGAGRPEAMFMMERLIDTAAKEMGIDRVKLRRMNFIRPDMLPWVSPIKTRYDSGEFDRNMMRALEMGGYAGFEKRRKEAKKRGKLRGFGFANYIETATGIPFERAIVKVLPEGKVNLTIGTQASGQGHETSFSQLLTEWLGVPFESVHLIHGDTDIILMGSGSHSCRSMRLGGLLIGRAVNDIVERGKQLAARALQANPAQIEFSGGKFRVAGTERAVSIFDAAALATEFGEPGLALESSHEITTMLPTFPNGCHVAEIEIDPDNGALDILRYAGVDDVGRVINPLLVDGQMHGSTAQGVGQALMEDCVYDPGSGQLLSGSFMDYAIPRADMFPTFEAETNEVPAPNNPLGVKGAGEGGTTAAPPALVNAIVDALRDYGVHHIEMPATPEKIWRAMRKA